jgi:hypothetical protein
MMLVNRLKSLVLLGLCLSASSGCASTSTPVVDGSRNDGGDALPDGSSLDGLAKSVARVSDAGEILSVGVVIPVASFEKVASNDPAFQPDVGLEMPAHVRDKTFIRLLRINWLASGHGPAPYGAPHFDLHFYRRGKDEVNAISCDTASFPPEILAGGYEPPSTCVPGMGYHAWPSQDLSSNTFTASIILGYAAQEMVFIEPMITREVFLARKSFELAIPRPISAGAATTLYPRQFSATYDAPSDAYVLEFSRFETIDQ